MEPEEYYVDDYLPLDEAVALMAEGLYLNEIEGWIVIDPYFED
jgi:hypothetical protein